MLHLISETLGERYGRLFKNGNMRQIAKKEVVISWHGQNQCGLNHICFEDVQRLFEANPRLSIFVFGEYST